jgi:hypothetical protein
LVRITLPTAALSVFVLSSLIAFRLPMAGLSSLSIGLVKVCRIIFLLLATLRISTTFTALRVACLSRLTLVCDEERGSLLLTACLLCVSALFLSLLATFRVVLGLGLLSVGGYVGIDTYRIPIKSLDEFSELGNPTQLS